MIGFLRVLLLCLLWLPVLAWGQEVPSEPSVQPTEEVTGTYSVVPHLILGSVLGAVGNVSGAQLGRTGALALKPGCPDFTCQDRFAISLFTGVGSAVGTALPVYFLGQLFDGQGSFGYTLLGASVAAIPSSFLSHGRVGDARVITGIVHLVTPIVGSFVGYGLSHRSAARPPAKLGAQVMPTFQMTREGRVVGGLVGQF